MIILFFLAVFLFCGLIAFGEIYYERDWPRHTGRFAIIAGILFLFSLSAFGQNTRWDLPITTVQAQGGNLLPVYAIPGAGIKFYSCSGSVCTTLATTYISATSGTTCPVSPTPMQVTLNGSSTCVSTADPYGNMGAWFQAGQYMATITAQGGSYNYYFTVGSGGSGTGCSPNLISGGCTGADNAQGAATNIVNGNNIAPSSIVNSGQNQSVSSSTQGTEGNPLDASVIETGITNLTTVRGGTLTLPPSRYNVTSVVPRINCNACAVWGTRGYGLDGAIIGGGTPGITGTAVHVTSGDGLDIGVVGGTPRVGNPIVRNLYFTGPGPTSSTNGINIDTPVDQLDLEGINTDGLGIGVNISGASDTGHLINFSAINDGFGFAITGSGTLNTFIDKGTFANNAYAGIMLGHYSTQTKIESVTAALNGTSAGTFGQAQCNICINGSNSAVVDSIIYGAGTNGSGSVPTFAADGIVVNGAQNYIAGNTFTSGNFYGAAVHLSGGGANSVVGPNQLQWTHVNAVDYLIDSSASGSNITLIIPQFETTVCNMDYSTVINAPNGYFASCFFPAFDGVSGVWAATAGSLTSETNSDGPEVGLFIPNTSSTAHSVNATSLGTGASTGMALPQTGTPTFTAQVKAAGYNFAAIQFVTGSGTLWGFANLSTCAAATVDSGLSLTVTGTGGGFCTLAGTLSVSSTVTGLKVAAAPSDNTRSFAGDGTSGIEVNQPLLFVSTVTMTPQGSYTITGLFTFAQAPHMKGFFDPSGILCLYASDGSCAVYSDNGTMYAADYSTTVGGSYSSQNGYFESADQIIPATVNGYNGNASGVKIPLSVAFSGSAGAAVCDDGSHNLTESGCSGGGGGVSSINSTAGAFTFTGSGVSCTTTTCAFSGGGSMTWPSGGAGVPYYGGSSAWGTSLTKFGSAVGIGTTTDPGTTAEVPMVADGSHGEKPSASGALGTGAFVPSLSLLKGTYTDGDWCSYTASGTLLNCNNAVPQAALSLIKGTYVDGDLCSYTASGTLLNCNTAPGGTGTVTDGSGTTTPLQFPESTSSAHVLQYRTPTQALGDMGAAPAVGNVTPETTSWSLVANNVYRFTGSGASNATTPATTGATGLISLVNAGSANVTVVTGTPTLVCIPSSCIVPAGASAFINTDGTDQYAIISNANGSAFGSLANASTINNSNWSGTVLAAGNGGTGVANTATLTLGSSNQNWATLGTGIVKNTTTTGVISDAAAADVYGLWSGTCNSSSYLRGDGACATPSGSGTVTASAQYDVAYYPTSGTVATVQGAAVAGFVYGSASVAPTAATQANLGTLLNITSGDVLVSGGSGSAVTAGAVAANLVVASSPGTGVAHFAGSTQTVTSSTIATADIAANAVTLAKLATQGADTFLANDTAGTAVPTAVAFPTTNHGVWLAQGTAAAPVATAAGTTAYPLVSGGASADPSFAQLTGAGMANNTVTAAQLATQYSKGSCTEVWSGSGTSSALQSGDDAISNNTCFNDSGVTRTITAVKARSSAGSNTTTVNPTFGSSGTGTTICSGALTAGSSYAYSSTCTVSNASWTTGTGIDPGMSGTLTGSSIAMIVEYTY